ncbi:HARB1 nuclease, partial [Amia calva]|nr:HARB1 nuclease [Amia calva]
VCLALQYFASGHYMYSIGDAEQLSKNTVCRAVPKVLLALTKLLDAFAVFPGHLSVLKIKSNSQYKNTWSIFNMHRLGLYTEHTYFHRNPEGGGIDCTHIPIRAPLGQHEGDYVNGKSFHIINVQVFHHIVFDLTCRLAYIIFLEARWPGPVHDSHIFRESTLGRRFEQRHFDGLLLGDRGYPCLRYLMTPYPDPQTSEQIKYNMAPSNTRVRIEIKFGVIKACFTCLQGLRVHREWACEVVAACVVLHNIATIRKERALCQLPDPVMLDHPRAIRKAITNKCFHQEKKERHIQLFFFGFLYLFIGILLS